MGIAVETENYAAQTALSLYNNKTQDFSTPDVYQPFISDNQMWYLNVYMNILLCGILAFFGIVNNIINMVVFFWLGLNDSMSICLFCLAVTDFLLCLIVFSSRIFPLWDMFFYHDAIDPMSLWYAGFGWLASSLFSCSGWITTYLSMERCVCVNFPFKVKDIFSIKRSISAIIFIYIVNADIPIYLTHWLEWIDYEVHLSNATMIKQRLVLKFSENRALVVYYVEIFTEYFLPTLSLILILSSALWMIYGLRISSKFRDATTFRPKQTNSGGRQDSRLTYKTRKLVKAVLVLAIIVSACTVTIPVNLIVMYYCNYPEISHDGQDKNLYHFLWSFTNFVSVINSSVNIIVYLTINSSYRAKFKELVLFSRSSRTKG